MRFLKSFSYAWQGIQHGFQTQPNFKIHVLGFIFMNLSSYYFRFDKWEYIACSLVSAFVFFAELVNTAIESTVDLVTKEKHPLAKVAKDCAAGAVLITAIGAIFVWAIIIYSKL